MKKLLTFFIAVTLVYSCSTNTDSNGNSSTSVVPIEPTNLTGTIASTTQINLSWTDNSTNETGFKIERKTGTGTYTIVGTTVTDVTAFNDTGLTPSTTYIYRVYSYNAVGSSLAYSNQITITTSSIINLPTLTTTSLSLVTGSTAVSGGNITSAGISSIIARGVCWSTVSNPTIALSTKTIDGTGIGLFTSNIIGLLANTTYYVRAYATTSVGTAYGNNIPFTTENSTALNVPGPNITDFDGNVYQTVTNCNQTWMKSNLNVSRYKNGDVIPQVTNPAAWASLTTGAWCYYNNDPINGPLYGKLYNWYAVNDPRGLAPTGWHIPTINDWGTFKACLGGAGAIGVAGASMQETGTAHWQSPNTIATNLSGFTARAGGQRYETGTFDKIRDTGFWWYSTQLNLANALVRVLYSNDGNTWDGNLKKEYGLSVRCIKD